MAMPLHDASARTSVRTLSCNCDPLGAINLTWSGLDICATIPSERRRGAASLSLQWGVDKADEMDVESFIEATIDGAQLYERFGYKTTQLMSLKKDNMDGDEEWQKLANEYPLECRWMERKRKSAKA